MKKIWTLAVVACVALISSCGGQKSGGSETDAIDAKAESFAKRVLEVSKNGIGTDAETSPMLEAEYQELKSKLSESDAAKFEEIFPEKLQAVVVSEAKACASNVYKAYMENNNVEAEKIQQEGSLLKWRLWSFANRVGILYIEEFYDNAFMEETRVLIAPNAKACAKQGYDAYISREDDAIESAESDFARCLYALPDYAQEIFTSAYDYEFMLLVTPEIQAYAKRAYEAEIGGDTAALNSVYDELSMYWTPFPINIINMMNSCFEGEYSSFVAAEAESYAKLVYDARFVSKDESDIESAESAMARYLYVLPTRFHDGFYAVYNVEYERLTTLVE